MTHPFEGVKVLDFCWVAIGPMTTRYFADFGATVVRIESIHRIDTIRTATPLKNNTPGTNHSAYFANYNSGKHSMALNMGDPRAKDVALELAKWADIVTENFTPGVMEKWGLGYEDLKKVNPNLIMFSASMQGRGGPFSNHPGFGPVLTALSGHTHLTGWPDRTPTSPYGAYTDFLLPRLAVAALGAALDHRRRTGQGVYIDMSQLEGSLYFVADALMDYAGNHRVPVRQGNRHVSHAPHNAYPCQGEDRWCAIGCQNDQDWIALCKVIGRPELAKDKRYATQESRKKHEDEIDKLISAWTHDKDAFDVMHRCQAAGVPAGVVQTCEDLFNDPQFKHRNHYVFLDHKEIGRHAYDGVEFKLSEGHPTYQPSPLLGEHTEWVCKEILGWGDARIKRETESGLLS
ncbi:MAG: CoA transferase [SAR202 cluster bacterium]|nr:CoA transferase [SAR202 cluster bacterium]